MRPTELKSVQERIIKYATEVGWKFVSREESDKRRSADAKALVDRGDDSYKANPELTP